MIITTEYLHHWNYFLALESDLKLIARYIELTEANFNTYSIELTRLLLTTCSEVDVLLKETCKHLEPTGKFENIKDYKIIMTTKINYFSPQVVKVERFGLLFTPWENWTTGTHPNWWRDYNHVKHERIKYYNSATVKNVLNSLAGLYVVLFHYYRILFKIDENINGMMQLYNILQPRTELFQFNEEISPGKPWW